MRIFSFLALTLFASALSLSNSYAASTASDIITIGTTQSEQQAMTPEQALAKLKAGNQRFLDGKMNHYDFTQIRENTAGGQYPFAVILSCLDSRSSPDITMDQGLGDVFVGRVAGNVANDDMIGSMEFATKLAGAKLIVVMGHTDCGAVKGACAYEAKGDDEDNSDSNLGDLLESIKPAVDEVSSKEKNFSCKNINDINKIAKQNVVDQVNEIYNDSDTIQELVNQNKLMIVGAMHDLKSGKIDYFYTFNPKHGV